MVTVEPAQHELHALAASADADTRRKLVERVDSRVRVSVGAILRNRADADDAAQSTWVEILKSTSTYRGENLGAWIARISGRTAMRQVRQRGLSIWASDLEAVADREPSVLGAHPISSHELARPLREYLAQLPKPLSEVLVMRHVLGHSAAEISSLTQTPINTVKGRLLRARARLRRAIRRDLRTLPVPSASTWARGRTKHAVVLWQRAE